MRALKILPKKASAKVEKSLSVNVIASDKELDTFWPPRGLDATSEGVRMLV